MQHKNIRVYVIFNNNISIVCLLKYQTQYEMAKCENFKGSLPISSDTLNQTLPWQDINTNYVHGMKKVTFLNISDTKFDVHRYSVVFILIKCTRKSDTLNVRYVNKF